MREGEGLRVGEGRVNGGKGEVTVKGGYKG